MEMPDGSQPVDGGRAIERVTLLGGETWTALARWARETNNLEEKQRSLAMSIGRSLGNGKGIAASVPSKPRRCWRKPSARASDVACLWSRETGVLQLVTGDPSTL